MRRGIYVPLPPKEREALFDLADSEWRSPREQAAKIIADALRATGALPAEHPPATDSGPSAALETLKT